eukprot:TRINITY_DN7226_c0_g3_i1.p1 TRINITY_DN7226_c0_g3~~TRINITY_DN7226_c0_g3_i1.p1  ORF type:complete len:428 (-),score=27.00 TRINITY_DN7226_c0_g3_i1:260-1465(-)
MGWASRLVGGACGGSDSPKKGLAAVLGMPSLSQVQLLLVASALFITASFLVSTRAIDLSTVDFVAFGGGEGAGGSGGGDGEATATFLSADDAGAGAGGQDGWLLGGGSIRGGGSGGWMGMFGGRRRVVFSSGGAAGAFGGVRALVRGGRDDEMAAMIAALDASSGAAAGAAGAAIGKAKATDTEQQDAAVRRQLVAQEWEYYQEAPYRFIDEFWRDVFEAASAELSSPDRAVRDAALDEITQLAGRVYDVHVDGDGKPRLVPKGSEHEGLHAGHRSQQQQQQQQQQEQQDPSQGDPSHDGQSASTEDLSDEESQSKEKAAAGAEAAVAADDAGDEEETEARRSNKRERGQARRSKGRAERKKQKGGADTSVESGGASEHEQLTALRIREQQGKQQEAATAR